MSKYINVEKQLVRLYRLGLDDEEVIKQFLLTACVEDVQEVRHGRWIMRDKGIIVTSYCCSECGRVVRDDTGYDVAIDYPYCHCGAKMDEDEK